MFRYYIKEILIPVLYYCGIINVANRIGKIYNKKIVLNYHNVDPDAFEKHLQYLTQNFIVCKPEEFFKTQPAGNKAKVLITFDDGYKRFYSHIQQLLVKYRVPAAIFIPTCIFKMDGIFFFDKLRLFLKKRRNNNLTIKDKAYKIDGYNEVAIASRVSNYLKTLTREDRDSVLLDIEKQLDPDLSSQDQDNYRMMSAEEVSRLDKDLIEVGSHAVSHELLAGLSHQQQEDELTGSKKLLEELGVGEIKYFAYPSGAYDNNTLNILKDTFTAAFTTNEGYFDDDNLYEINRISVDDALPVKLLAAKLSPLFNHGRR